MVAQFSHSIISQPPPPSVMISTMTITSTQPDRGLIRERLIPQTPVSATSTSRTNTGVQRDSVYYSGVTSTCSPHFTRIDLCLSNNAISDFPLEEVTLLSLRLESRVRARQVADTFAKRPVLGVNIINLSHGAALGWVSPYLPVLMNPDQDILDTGPVTIEQGSWIGSILCLGALFGAFLYGFMVEKVGIKRTLQALVVPHSAFWIITCLATSVTQLYLARFLAGLSGGGIIVVFPLFIADISDKKIRGILGSFLALTSNGGILLMYVIGDVLSYRTVALSMLVLPLIFTILMCFIPDTPQTCLKMGRPIEAERCFMFYRGIKTPAEKTSAFRQEFDNMEKFIEHNAGQSSRVTLADFQSREAKLGLFIGVFLMFINQFCGVFAILTYAASIFAGVGSTLDPNTSAIIMGTIQIVGTLSSFVFVDLAGRKVLLIVSTFGTGLGLLLLAVFNWFTGNGAEQWLQDYSWFPIVSLSATVYLFSIGLCNIPFFVLPELLPPKICNVGNTLSMVSITIFSFISLKIFPIMVEVIKLYGALGLFAGISFAGVAMIALIVPETKGKNLIGPQNV
ncbi:facilitated trehalose transporter Tret1-like [Anopheles nili]|uniref:facilitated trehalose transporter Tret1-like n=1 Tax=Anopheles nili TaxID=185578 RepID=UPI00237AA455|nr:facilitated trehalose transporter Tret1-like [Anopheles nili]